MPNEESFKRNLCETLPKALQNRSTELPLTDQHFSGLFDQNVAGEALAVIRKRGPDTEDEILCSDLRSSSYLHLRVRS